MPENTNEPTNYPTSDQAIGELLIRIFGKAANNLGSVLAPLPYCAKENVFKILSRAQNILRNRNVRNIKLISNREIVPLITYTSQEDNEAIQKMWAGLIANSLDPSKNQDINRHLINIIGQLDPIDAQIIQYIAEKKLSEGDRIDIKSSDINEKYHLDENKIGFSVQNMGRLGLFDITFAVLIAAETSKSLAGKPFVNIDHPFFDGEATHLLFHLIEACSDDVSHAAASPPPRPQ